MDKNMLYRSIPKVDVLLADEKIQTMIDTYSRETVMESIHLEMNRLRVFIGKCEDEEEAKRQIETLPVRISVCNAHSEYAYGNEWYGDHSSYKSGKSTDQPGAYEESGSYCDRIFKSGV